VKTGFAKVEGGVLVGFRVRGLCSAVVNVHGGAFVHGVAFAHARDRAYQPPPEDHSTTTTPPNAIEF
jgi:hypothetical protein